MDAGAVKPVLAIDLGGTQIRAAHVSPDLTVSLRRAVPTGKQDGVAAVIGRLCDLAAQVRDECVRSGMEAPIGIGISAPGPLDPWRGIVVSPPNLPDWREVPLVDRVESALQMSTYMERDTNVAVMAEWQYGAARGFDDVIYLTVSTGIGGGIVLGGRPAYGLDDTAGEVGHVTIDLDGPRCGDGMPGHVEAIGSGTAVARDGRSLVENGEAPILARLVADGATLDAALVARAADAGDRACQAIYDRVAVAIGALCSTLVMVLNPQVIVIGGSVAEHRPGLLEVVRREISGRSWTAPARRVRVLPPQFGADVSLIGSLPIVNQRLNDPAYRREATGD